MVRQERTSVAEMRRLGKPHREQRQIAQMTRLADAQVGGTRLTAMCVPERWSSCRAMDRASRGSDHDSTESGLQAGSNTTVTQPQTQLDSIERLEASLWEAADQLRANSKLTSSEYCMPVLGIIFLRHATNRYAEALRQIEAGRLTSYALAS